MYLIHTEIITLSSADIVISGSLGILQPETATLQQTKATPSEARDRALDRGRLLRETCDLERLSDKIFFSFNFSKHQTTPM